MFLIFQCFLALLEVLQYHPSDSKLERSLLEREFVQNFLLKGVFERGGGLIEFPVLKSVRFMVRSPTCMIARPKFMFPVSHGNELTATEMANNMV